MYNDVKHSYSMTVCCIILANSVNIASVTKKPCPTLQLLKGESPKPQTNHVTRCVIAKILQNSNWQKQKNRNWRGCTICTEHTNPKLLVAFNDLLDVHKKCPTLSLSPSPVTAEHSCLFRPRKVHSTLSLCLHPACAHLTCCLYTLGTAILIRIRAFLEERLPSCPRESGIKMHQINSNDRFQSVTASPLVPWYTLAILSVTWNLQLAQSVGKHVHHTTLT